MDKVKVDQSAARVRASEAGSVQRVGEKDVRNEEDEGDNTVALFNQKVQLLGHYDEQREEKTEQSASDSVLAGLAEARE
jgi:hypothetical protein